VRLPVCVSFRFHVDVHPGSDVSSSEALIIDLNFADVRLFGGYLVEI
jgi:hypothetical protein